MYIPNCFTAFSLKRIYHIGPQNSKEIPGIQRISIDHAEGVAQKQFFRLFVYTIFGQCHQLKKRLDMDYLDELDQFQHVQIVQLVQPVQSFLKLMTLCIWGEPRMQ